MIDRLLLIALVLGVWALVLEPTAPSAHSGQQCDVSGTGWGEMDGNEVYVYKLNATAYCF